MLRDALAVILRDREVLLGKRLKSDSFYRLRCTFGALHIPVSYLVSMLFPARVPFSLAGSPKYNGFQIKGANQLFKVIDNSHLAM